MPRPARLAAALACAAVLVAASVPEAAPPGYAKPAAKDKCPVCGMFVARYPEWTAQILFADGRREFFDGAKDLFRYWHDMPRYGGTGTPAGVTALIVTDYYDLEPIDGRTAFYVVGSDVLGPMGEELIPFAGRQAAEEFVRDHKGTAILRFGDVPDNR